MKNLIFPNYSCHGTTENSHLTLGEMVLRFEAYEGFAIWFESNHLIWWFDQWSPDSAFVQDEIMRRATRLSADFESIKANDQLSNEQKELIMGLLIWLIDWFDWIDSFYLFDLLI